MKGTTRFTLLRCLVTLLACGSAAGAAESIFPDTVTPAGRGTDTPNWERGTIFHPTLPGMITEVRVFSLTEESGDHQVRIWRNADNSLIYELGTKFQGSVAGKITHLRVFSLASEAGDHTARLWRNDDETVIGGPYTWTYGGSTGWIQLDIPDVPIEANVEYTVSVSTGSSPKRNYPNVAADLLVAGGNGQHLTYPVNAGVFTETREARPTGSFNGGNYLRDVVFLPAGAEEPTTPLRILEIKPDLVSGNVTLRWEGEGPQFQVEKAATVSGPFQAVGAAQTERVFTDPGVLKTTGQSYYRVR